MGAENTSLLVCIKINVKNRISKKATKPISEHVDEKTPPNQWRDKKVKHNINCRKCNCHLRDLLELASMLPRESN